MVHVADLRERWVRQQARMTKNKPSRRDGRNWPSSLSSSRPSRRWRTAFRDQSRTMSSDASSLADSSAPPRGTGAICRVHPGASPRGVGPARLRRRGNRSGPGPHLAAGHQRRADRVPRVPGPGRRAEYRHQGVRDGARRRHPARRHRRPSAAGAGPGLAVQSLELVAAPRGRQSAARRALASAAEGAAAGHPGTGAGAGLILDGAVAPSALIGRSAPGRGRRRVVHEAPRQW